MRVTPRLLVASLAVLGMAAPGALRQDTAPWPRKGETVGPARCIQCHDVEAGLIADGFHRDVVHSPATLGCETCHGPGAIHAGDERAASITYPPLLTPAVQARLCGHCHANEASRHAGGGVEGFLAAGIGCTECHPVHDERPPTALPGVRFLTRAATMTAAERVDATQCVRCHPLQDTALHDTGHAGLAAGAGAQSCEACHGNGSLHVTHGGISRLISRPDRARDTVATCRACHTAVDAETFHWKTRDEAWLSDDVTCTSCHSVHGSASRDPAEQDTARQDTANQDTPNQHTGRAVSPPEPTNRECASCHLPGFEVLRGSVHESLGALDLALERGCGACHDGALEHARSGGRPQLIESLHDSDVRTEERVCLACHGDRSELRGVRHGTHAQRGVSCVDCHSFFVQRGDVRRQAEQRCAACHADVAARFRLPNAHPVGDRRMGCSDCHDVHGDRGSRRALELREERCVDCHRQYRGPFAFPHRAGERDGCTVCHDPHGSPNRRLLHQTSTQQNCIACHGDFPAFHDQSSGSVFTNCLNCHTRIHGSDHSRFFFR
ncbi:MAG: cytochrome c3 family protein [Planctomycetes bacterium]|nr:cytochrome c3 family protein [Planctomycetota bacterium]